MISSNQIELGNGLYEIRIEGLRLVMRKSDGYINATKLCKDAGKEFSHWKRNDGVEELISEFESALRIRRGDLIQSSVAGEFKGTYVHPDIAIQIANWCSPKFAVQVSSIVKRFYSGDLFLIPEIAQNYNASHEETKVAQVEVTLTKREEIELEKEKALINKMNVETIERFLALLDINEPRQKLVSDSLKINAANYLQRSLGNVEEIKAPQELPALQILINQLVRVSNKGAKQTVKLALEHFTLLVSKKIAQRYRELHRANPKQKSYMNENGILIKCNMYTTEDEQMLRETILNYVSEYNLKNKFGIIITAI